jgi:hypothetical protein
MPMHGGRSVGNVRADTFKRDGPRRGGAEPSSEADLARGVGLSPRARRTPPEGALRPRARWNSPEGASNPRARRISPEGVSNTRGAPRYVALAGRRGHQGRGCVVHVF